MFHLAGFSASQDTATLANIAALADQAINTSGNDLIVPDDLPLLIATYVLGPSLTRAQVTSPSMRRSWTQELLQIDLSATPTDQLLVAYHIANPIVLDTDEQLNALMSEGAAGASRGTVLVWLADTPPNEIIGQDIRTIRFTSTTAAVANVWSNIAIAFNDTLPAGRYSIVGAMLQSANMQAFRIVPRGAAFRPGAIGITALSQRHNEMFRHGNMGEWGQFDHNVPPTIDVLCNGADASFTGVMDLVYLR